MVTYCQSHMDTLVLDVLVPTNSYLALVRGMLGYRRFHGPFCSDLALLLALHALPTNLKWEKIIRSKKATEHHKKAWRHLTHAARHHGEAAHTMRT